jgi:hypothetical protein
MSDFVGPIQPDLGDGGAAQAPIAIRSALVGAISRRRSTLRMRGVIAGAACVALTAALLVGGVFTGGPEPVLAIDDDGGEWVKIRIIDGGAGAAEMTHELQDAGIDGEVRLLPAIPEFVGHWLGLNQVDPRQAPHYCEAYPIGKGPRAVCANPPLVGGDNARFEGDTFQLRRDVIGDLAGTRTIFYVGREPGPGETAQEFPPADRPVTPEPNGR